MNVLPKQVIYVELDVLLDTRLGTLTRLSPEAAMKVLTTNYQQRESDNFEGVDMAQYRELYASRDIETLKNSICTGAMPLLRHIVELLAQQAIERPFHSGGELHVNLHPYQLSDEEIQELQDTISGWVHHKAPVQLINVDLTRLTPEACKNTYAMMLMYDYAQWFNMHGEALQKTKLTDVTMFVPALYFEKAPTAEELTQLIDEAMHPFAAAELIASPVLDLKLIDVRYFSVVDLLNLPDQPELGRHFTPSPPATSST